MRDFLFNGSIAFELFIGCLDNFVENGHFYFFVVFLEVLVHGFVEFSDSLPHSRVEMVLDAVVSPE